MVATHLAAGLLTAALLATTAPSSLAAPAAAPTKDREPGTIPGHSRVHMPQPRVIAHRGASGYRPEHTRAAYELAVEMGADYIEPDLVMTKDGVLVDRHEPEISGTTDIASRPEFASRRATKLVDGVPTTGWFVEDLTLAELKTLRAVERLPQLRPESARYDGQLQVLTFEEGLQLRERLSREHRRAIGIIPEIKHSSYLHAQGLDPEAELVRLVKKYRLNRPTAPMWTQSFELSNLKALRDDYGYKANLVFLTSATGGPYDLHAQGTTYAQLTTASSLRDLSRWVDGIGPEKAQVIPRTADGRLGTPTTLVRDAHAAGLQVTPWTFRAENYFLPVDYRIGTDLRAHGRAADEVRAYLETGVDGVFCDQPDICVDARAEYLADR